MHIFRNIFKFSVKLKIKVICKTFAAPRECKTFADHFDFHFDGKFVFAIEIASQSLI